MVGRSTCRVSQGKAQSSGSIFPPSERPEGRRGYSDLMFGDDLLLHPFREGINLQLPRAERKKEDAMDIVVEYLRDPIVCGIIIAGVMLMIILALRTRSVFTPEAQKWKETRRVLLGGLVIYLLIAGWEMMLPGKALSPTTRHLEPNASPIAISTPFPTQAVTPTQVPSPMPTVAL